MFAIYFTANGPPRKLIDGSISTIFPRKEQKEEQKKSLRHRCFPVNFAEILEYIFKRTITVAASEDEHDETKLLQYKKKYYCNDIAIEQMLSLNDSY